MRHFIVGALLVLAALAVTSVTAQLLEQAAMNRKASEGTTAIVEGPSFQRRASLAVRASSCVRFSWFHVV